jgi:putative nucleotidyltransferase with HDIG domain
MEKQSAATDAKDPDKPVILLFSTRERIGDVLNVALMQCNYRIIQANTSYLAMIKANQFLPDLVIADITPNNTVDTLLISRLQKSLRTRRIPVLAVVPSSVRHIVAPLQKQPKDPANAPDSGDGSVTVLEYPFNFAELLKKIENLVTVSKQTAAYTGDKAIDTANADKFIAPTLYDPTVQLEAKLRAVESVIHRQWAFPFTVIKALDITSSDASCMADLAKCIETDLAASTAILKVANAVYYAKRGSRVMDVQEAVVRLGFRETNNLLACLALIDLSPEHRGNYGFTRDEFWLHSLATALIAEKLAKDAGHLKPELSFIAGLIHDLGKIPLDNNFEKLFPKILEETTSSMSSFYATEQRLLGFSHAELGHYLTSKWNFPSSICMAILYHHRPNLILETPTPNDRLIQEAVFAADILAKAMSLGHTCDEVLEEIPAEILRNLHVPNGPNESFFGAIIRDLYVLCKYLGIAPKNLFLAKQNSSDQRSDIVVVFDKKFSYHPIVTALRNNGFSVRTTTQISPELYHQVKIVIFIPDKGFPLDIMFYDDDTSATSLSATLKMFLLDTLPEKRGIPQGTGPDMVFLDRLHLDMRYVLHTLDRFLGTVVAPEKQDVQLSDEPDTGT